MDLSLQTDLSTRLLQSLHALQQRLLTGKDSPEKGLQHLLELLVDVTGSETGLIGKSVHTTQKDQIRMIAWLDTTAFATNAAADEICLANHMPCRIYALLHQAIQSNVTLIENNCTENIQQPIRKNTAKSLPFIHFIALPFHLEESEYGVLGLQSTVAPYTEELIKTLEPALQTIAVCINNIHSKENVYGIQPPRQPAAQIICPERSRTHPQSRRIKATL